MALEALCPVVSTEPCPSGIRYTCASQDAAAMHDSMSLSSRPGVFKVSLVAEHGSVKRF